MTVLIGSINIIYVLATNPLTSPMSKFINVSLSPSARLKMNSAKVLAPGVGPTPDTSPLRLAQHDIAAGVDEHLRIQKNFHTGLNNQWVRQPDAGFT